MILFRNDNGILLYNKDYYIDIIMNIFLISAYV